MKLQITFNAEGDYFVRFASKEMDESWGRVPECFKKCNNDGESLVCFKDLADHPGLDVKALAAISGLEELLSDLVVIGDYHGRERRLKKYPRERDPSQ